VDYRVVQKRQSNVVYRDTVVPGAGIREKQDSALCVDWHRRISELTVWPTPHGVKLGFYEHPGDDPDYPPQNSLTPGSGHHVLNHVKAVP
jgi:hypothetical protein